MPPHGLVRRRGTALLTALSVLLLSLLALGHQAQAATAVFGIRSYGAVGNGSTDDTGAINAAIAAANKAHGGGIVDVPAGTYVSAESIHMLSNVNLRLDAGATIVASGKRHYDAAEANPYDAYQDYGHSHFHDAMIWGNDLSNVAFTGSGTVDGGGYLASGTPAAGQADKILSLTRIDGLTISGITLKRGGHFAILDNDVDHLTSDHLTISTAADRDGWDLMSTRNATITNIKVSSNDDALGFKSDWALGETLPSGNVVVDHATLNSACCNALMFGSETCGNFNNYTFENIVVTGTGKSGLGMVSMDGANISDVHYTNIAMSGTKSPVFVKLGARLRCGGTPTVGSITDITYDHVTDTGVGPFTATLWGRPGHPLRNITFTDVDLTVPGGSPAVAPGVPSDNGDYNPNSIGARPSYGWYLYNVDGVTFDGSAVHLQSPDARPAVIANSSADLVFDRFTADRGTAPYDLGFQSVTGYCLLATPLRVSSTDSTESCAG